MADTPFNLSKGFSQASLSDFSNNGKIVELSNVNLGFVIAFACIGFVMFFVPENPHQLASICEKHNSEFACQVW